MSAKGSILIIDPNTSNRSKIRRICSRLGLICQEASSWKRAQMRIRKRYYDIIIIGIEAPVPQLVEMIQTIRHLGLDSCVITSLHYRDTAKIVKCLEAGAYDTILLPIRDDWVRIQISRALERRMYYDEAQKKEHYWRLSIFDELTRIHNHRYFHYWLSKEMSSAKRYGYALSLLMLDIDNFKIFNDRFGHLAGDEVLRSLGILLSDSIRAGDIAARYGGEEFAIMLPHANKRGARAVAETLRKKVETLQFSPDGFAPPTRLTISAGVSSYPRDAKTKDALIRKADSALYMAKRKGKNKVCCA